MTDGIYNTPEANLSEGIPEVKYHLASTGQRFFNLIIDTFGFLAFSVFTGAILGLVGLIDLIEQINDYVFGYGLMTFYFLAQEAIWGRTLGKLVTKTKVLAFDDSKPSFGQLLGRTLVRFIPFEAFSFLFGDGLPRGWHDSWSGTKVISLKDIQE